MTAISNEDPQADWGLPGWIYGSERFFKEEQDRIFRPSWQIVCHLNDIPKAGDFHTFDFVGESLVVLRGKDGGVRAFANVCRHRGARLLDGLRGLDVVDARGAGLFLGVELSSRAEAARVKEALKARGILISTDGPNEDVLKIKPPLVISADDCDLLLNALADVL